MTQAGVPFAGQAVALGAQPGGDDRVHGVAGGHDRCGRKLPAVIKPTKRTTYKAGFTGVTPEPTAVVAVKHSITLKGRRRSGKVYLRGTIGPRHVRRVVRIQRRTGKRWVTIAKVRTSRKSNFKLVRKATPKRAKYRASLERTKSTSRTQVASSARRSRLHHALTQTLTTRKPMRAFERGRMNRDHLSCGQDRSLEGLLNRELSWLDYTARVLTTTDASRRMIAMRVGIVDVGANTLRLLVAAPDAGGRRQVGARRAHSTRARRGHRDAARG